MPSKRALILRIVALVVFFEFLATIPHAFAADTEKVLHSFGNQRDDGYAPWAALILDAAGNLFGSASYGGAHGDGMVFRLTREANGTWTETVLHSFSGADGMYPVASLVFGASGNLYGTTANGGSGCGCGTVFELTPAANGRWTETVLHRFNGNDGMYPFASLTLDADGNLYGTASQGGGAGNWGTVFQLTPSAGGKWTYRVLHRFNGDDGAGPDSGLIFDAVGNLYGTTHGGGVGQCDRSLACGTVFQLVPGTGSKWTEKVLHSFNGFGQDLAEGAYPSGGVIFDAAGNLYGTTGSGGSALCGDLGGFGCGTVFQLTRRANGKWVERTLHSFDEEDGAFPNPGLIRDRWGNLYGTTVRGGYSDGGSGTVFQVAPGANGSWTEAVLYVFCSVNDCTDGYLPRAGVISDSAGNLYGTTSDGGTSSGTVFEITPQGAPHSQ